MCVSSECCAQILLNAIYYVILNLRSISLRIIQAKFLAQFVWRPRGKLYPQIITFKMQNLDHHFWSIFALKRAPVFVHKNGQNLIKNESKNASQILNKKFFYIAQILFAILVIWIAQISIAHAQNNARALPTAGQVVAGAAVITQSGLQTQVNQASQRAVVNWDSFNVGKDATVTFNQPNSSAVTLNRVTGSSPSVIDGAIKANGQVV